MIDNSSKHHRRSIRLKGYDYSKPGLYYITVCTQDRDCLFGRIVDDKMVLNTAGHIVRSTWNSLPRHYQSVELDV